MIHASNGSLTNLLSGKEDAQTEEAEMQQLVKSFGSKAAAKMISSVLSSAGSIISKLSTGSVGRQNKDDSPFVAQLRRTLTREDTILDMEKHRTFEEQRECESLGKWGGVGRKRSNRARGGAQRRARALAVGRGPYLWYDAVCGAAWCCERSFPNVHSSQPR